MPDANGYPARSRGAVLPPPRVSIAIRHAVLAEGARATAARLGLSDTTVSRIAGRLPCHRASIELAARRLGIDLESGTSIPVSNLTGNGGDTAAE